MRGHYSHRPLIGIEAYGVPRSVERFGGRSNLQSRLEAQRMIALNAARKVYAATGNPNIGFRDTPWGSETTVFGSLSGLQRWSNEQGQDTDVWYAATFNFMEAQPLVGEIMR